MAYTSRPFNYTGTLPNQVQNDLELANNNFDVLGQAFIGNDPSSKPVKRAVYIGSTAPSDAVADSLWLDTSVSPPRLKVYNGTNWINFDADTVDGFHASQTPQAFTIPVAGSTGKLDAGWLPAVGNLNVVRFTTSGTWTVPAGVTKIMVSAVAGGGGGGGSSNTTTPGGTGGTGGSTSITGSVSGTLFSLAGGDGGTGGWQDTNGSNHPGATGLAYLNISIASFYGISSPFGRGGASGGAAGSGYGSGGAGGATYGTGGGGGCGEFLIGKVFSVSPGETLTITIGAGGSGGSKGSGPAQAGGAGAPGFVEIIYFG